MVLGTVLVLTALSLFLLNQREDRQAGASVEEVLPKLLEYIEGQKDEARENGDLAESNSFSSVTGSQEAGQENGEFTGFDVVGGQRIGKGNDGFSMKSVQIGGNDYIGYLSIPDLNLDLPVMAEWSYPRLRIAPCRYTGALQTDNLVIAAHNYARHFGSLSKLSMGDKVYFFDVEGIIWVYEVATIDTLGSTDVVEMTSGEYPLTLFTCTYGGKSRITVRCERI